MEPLAKKGDDLREPLVLADASPVPVSNSDRKPEDQVPQFGRCRDPLWALAFLGMLATIVAYSVKGFVFVIGKTEGDSGGGASGGLSADDGKIVGAVAAAPVLAGVLCAAWLGLILSHAESVLLWSYQAYFILLAVCALVAFVQNQVVLGLFLVFVLAMAAVLWRRIRQRIPFAAANLVTACTALRHNNSIYAVTFGMIAVAVAWVVVFVFALVGILHHPSDTTKTCWPCWILLFLSFVWGAVVWGGIAHVTVSGTVGAWWFKPDDPLPVSASFRRATTTSFGSVCFGSFIIAVLDVIKTLLGSSKRGGCGGCLLCCFYCCARCLENIARYVNRYALSYCGLYGHDFVASAKHVFQLFSGLGWVDAVVNDTTVSVSFYMGALSVGAIVAMFEVVLAFALFQDPDDVVVAWLAVVGFLIGYFIASVVANTVSAAVATVFVAFAESDEALQRNHPERFVHLFEAWQKFHPTLIAHIVFLPETAVVQSAVPVDAV